MASRKRRLEMQRISAESPLEDSSPEPEATPAKTRKTRAQTRTRTRTRTTTACDACRARRTRCDSRKPTCGYCRACGLQCHYEQNLQRPTSKVEAELAAINQRLDHITSIIPLAGQGSIISDGLLIDPSPAPHVFTGQEKLPFQLLGTEGMMTTLGLSPGFAAELARVERKAPPAMANNTSRIHLLQQQQALGALAAFSAHVHVWHPILGAGFSQRYLAVMSGPWTPGPESCLVLLVAAIGTLAQQDHELGASSSDDTSKHYLEAAMASLPAVLIDSGVEGVQCLVLLSIYHCCLSKPCQAHDFAMMASFKVQNLLKHVDSGQGEVYEQAKRAYWAVLLLESELRVQFDVVDSGIWNHDDIVALPDSRRSWQFDMDASSPQSAVTSPLTNVSAEAPHADRTQSYFLAEISMRRMLHRCNTAIRRTAEGQVVYAPKIALELEHQLDEWYSYLPDIIRFQDLDLDVLSSPPQFIPLEPLSNFLRVQYYCCKLSIYWPAIYQSIQDGTATAEVLRHCERFFHAYIQLTPSTLSCIRYCIVNRWTLYATVFMTSMAVMLAAQTPHLRDGCVVNWRRLMECLRSTRNVDRRVIDASPSLLLLESALAQRLAETHTSHGENNELD